MFTPEAVHTLVLLLVCCCRWLSKRLPLPLLLTHLQAGQAVKEDEVIAQIETDKVTIDIKAPSAGTLEQLLVKPSDTVVAGQVVAVVGAGAAGAAPAAAATAQAAAPAPPASPTAPSSPHHERVPMIRFPPRVTPTGARISDLPASQYDAAVAEATAASFGSTAAPAAASAAASAPAPEPSRAAAPLPPPAAKVAPPPTTKNKLTFVTRPDGRGGPPRRPLTARELELINLGGAW